MPRTWELTVSGARYSSVAISLLDRPWTRCAASRFWAGVMGVMGVVVIWVPDRLVVVRPWSGGAERAGTGARC